MHPHLSGILISLAAAGLCSACGGDMAATHYGCAQKPSLLGVWDPTAEETIPAGGCGRKAGVLASSTVPVTHSQPIISLVDPPASPAGQEVTLTISGRHLVPGSRVKLGGAWATSLRYPSDPQLVGTQIIATFPPQARLVSFVPIVVEAPTDESATRVDLFSFYVEGLPTFFGSPAAGGDPCTVRIGDFDGDGITDVVTADMSAPANVVSYLFPRVTEGTFPDELKSLAITNPTWMNPDPEDQPEFIDVAPGDLDEDGHLDLVLAQGTTGDIRVMFNNGRSIFARSQRLHLGGLVSAVAVADLNHDKHLDILAVSTDTSQLSVFLGKGDGQFAPRRVFSAGTSPFGLTLADINGDGRMDALLTNLDSDDISLLLGDGTGGFADEQRRATCQEPRAIAVADLDLDGAGDIVTSCPRAGGIQILFGQSPGRPEHSTFIPIAGLAYGIALADFDADQKIDIAVGNFSGFNISILRNRRDQPGVFAAPVEIQAGFLRKSTAPFILTVADVNNDKLPDIITANLKWGGIGLILSHID